MSTTTTSNPVLQRSASKRGSVEKPRPLKSMSSNGGPKSNNNNSVNSDSSPLSNKNSCIQPSLSQLSSFEISSVENTMSLLENVALKLGNGVYDATVTQAILNLSASLKSWGPFIEVKYKDSFDRCQIALRNACRDEKLALVARLHLLEIFELRALNWKATESMTNYYKQKIAQVEHESHHLSTSSPTNIDSPRSSISSPVNKAPLSTPLAATKDGRKKKKNSGYEEMQLFITVGDQEIKISGFDSSILRVAKSVLQKHFEKKAIENMGGRHRVNNNALQRSKSVLCDSHVNIIRTPLFPDSPKSAFQEESDITKNRETRDRRAQFAKNRSKTTLGATKEASQTRNGGYHKNHIHYDRKQLLQIASSQVCQNPPKNWDYVSSVVPEITRRKTHGSPLPIDWEATFLFSKKSQYSEHCDREGKNIQKFGRDSRA
ncbi:unnamed protein product [Lepeophtheirus salmonis]|uniref:(salmon louse) hypothetical protein n=1 Tax=Lepeophtheirus salmonis TaxID=72036 RepID=A0A7R8CNX0_LEPSM|nr:unnamed protein product [Lepeophtheirus salmonis]CAF2880787.1 unnamed protein product [Lepeophtheirus salmonis]